ncbi:DNA repair protein RadC [candidate division WOR-3 bacterium]|nr:DNA repair protein RadC [candidate division WOR-3 bacterium]
MCDKYFTLHDLPQEDRPRERLKEVGVDNLSIQELLALVVEKGRKGKSVLSVSQNLLARFGNLAKMKEASIEELQEVDGIGFATACKLKAALKLGEKALSKHNKFDYQITTPKDVFELLKNDMGNKKKEHFKILSLTTRKKLISIDDISIGILDSSLAHPREIFKPAIQNSAASIILVHNHPSGDPTPSKDDIKMTERLIEAGKIIGIEIDDHVIISDNLFASLRSDPKTSRLWRK